MSKKFFTRIFNAEKKEVSFPGILIIFISVVGIIGWIAILFEGKRFLWIDDVLISMEYILNISELIIFGFLFLVISTFFSYSEEKRKQPINIVFLILSLFMSLLLYSILFFNNSIDEEAKEKELINKVKNIDNYMKKLGNSFHSK